MVNQLDFYFFQTLFLIVRVSEFLLEVRILISQGYGWCVVNRFQVKCCWQGTEALTASSFDLLRCGVLFGLLVSVLRRLHFNAAKRGSGGTPHVSFMVVCGGGGVDRRLHDRLA